MSSNELDKSNQEIEAYRKKIIFLEKQGQATSKYQNYLNEAIAKRDNLIKYGDSQQLIMEIRAGINEKTKIVEKLTQENQTFKHSKETYDKMETEFVESAKKLLATLNL